MTFDPVRTLNIMYIDLQILIYKEKKNTNHSSVDSE
jgi:hypothetical protein